MEQWKFVIKTHPKINKTMINNKTKNNKCRNKTNNDINLYCMYYSLIN